MKTLQSLHQSSATHWVGNGFPVRSVFDYNSLGRELDPFLLLDYAAPHRFAPGRERRGVDAHPHRGFETVTIAYQGELEHRDSSGGGGKIGPGDVQWMTAASGIIHQEYHSEAFTREGGTLEMLQLWVNLPAKHKDAAPGYQTLSAKDIPIVSLPGDAGHVRVIAGDFDGKKGPARTFTPINLWDVTLKAGRSVDLPLPQGQVAAVFVSKGNLQVASRRTAAEGTLAVFDRDGACLSVKALSDTKLLVMGGEPINEPIVGHGPFVMNTQDEIRQAFHDYQTGAFDEISA